MKRTLLVLLLALAASGARAESFALLIGVTGYPTLPEHLRLRGPRNDVQRMHQLLLQRGFAQARIRTLADGVPGAAEPTRAAILQALERLAVDAGPGDTVFVLYAGHGSRQPAPEGGLRPILLPLDVGRWDGGAQGVANAITSRELRERIDRIADRGAFVWGVFDACHSATLVRGAEAGAELRLRQVAPAELGVDEAALARAEQAAPRTRGGRSDPAGLLDAPGGASGGRRGGTAFFYAAQVDEMTPELPLPAGAAARQPYGLFSFVVGRALERAQPMSYRQLAQYVLAEYGDMRHAGATPLFSGDALDAPVLGQRQPPVRQWPLRLEEGGATVAAGRLSGIAPGAVFAVLPGPLARDGERLGHLQAGTVEAARSLLVPVAHGGLPAPAVEQLRARSGLYLRLVASPPEFSLRVAFDPGDCAAACPLREAVRRLQSAGAAGVDLQWTEPSAGPDLLLRVQRGRATYAARTDGAAARGDAELPGLALQEAGRELGADALATRLAHDLHTIARARNLLALAARFAAEPRPSGLLATLRRGGEAIAPEQVPALHDGDQLALEVQNQAGVALDLTVLYADAEQGITALFPTRLGDANRLAPGQRLVIDGIRINAPPAGLERLLLITSPAQPQAERADYTFLAQPSLPRRRGSADDDFDAFADAAFADYRQRGASRPAAPRAGTDMRVFTLNVQRPAAAAGAAPR